MRNKVNHVQTGHTLLVQVVDGVRVLLAKDGHQHIGTGNFLFATARALHMHDGALNDALKAKRGLGIDLVGTRHLRRVVLDKVCQRLAQVINIC